ncbi:MAG: MFS transporter [Saprospirales bacterium]|nr:MFS transporter [Saprospirales bacterium]
MSQENPNKFKAVFKEITAPFLSLFKTSRALLGINISYFLEGLIYFGMLGLLAMYFNEYVGLNDIQADKMVGILTAGITLSMLILGAAVDLVGVRKSLLVSLVLMLVGRIFLSGGPGFTGNEGMWSNTHLVAMFGIFWIVLGYGIYQPASYAAVKRFTNKDTSAMGYAMLYALMNLGAFLPGLISPPIRKSFGISGVFWVYTALTVVGMAAVAILLTKKAIAQAEKENGNFEEVSETEEKKPFKEQVLFYLKNFPIRDARFMFFIFALIPVQTLFAHNWLTLPQYCERAFSGVVQENFEFFVNFNPLLIFVLTPLVAAYTAKNDTYKMMIYGTLIMAASPFILVSGPHIGTLFAFLIVMTIGEAMWQPRFLQWVAEIAPKGMTGIYMGLGQFPWFLTKVVTSLYAGWFLMNYCPDDTPISGLNTEEMWLIYAFIAMISPVALIMARGWMVKGFKVKDEG